jgi:RNA polymerase sigma-B factor
MTGQSTVRRVTPPDVTRDPVDAPPTHTITLRRVVPGPDVRDEPAAHPGAESRPRSTEEPTGSPERNSSDLEYAHLAPLLAEFAELADKDPRRAELRDRLVTGYLPVAQHIARRFAQRGVALDDLVQVGTVGLINAVDRYEYGRGPDFLAFAVPTIRGEIRRYFRDHAWAMRVPRRLKDLHISLNRASSELSQSLGRAPRPSELAAHLGLPVEEVLEGLEAAHAYRGESLDETLSNDSDSTTLSEVLGEMDSALELTEYRHTLRPLLAELPERERSILMLRFFGDLTQSQIATHIGVSQMHVSRLLSQTLVQLRERMRAD